MNEAGGKWDGHEAMRIRKIFQQKHPADEFRNCLNDSSSKEERTQFFMEFLINGYCQVDNVQLMCNFDNFSRFDSSESLKKIDAPSLVIAGKWDTAVPLSHVKRVHQGIPDSNFIEFENSGHFPFLTEHDRFNQELLRFLTSKQL